MVKVQHGSTIDWTGVILALTSDDGVTLFYAGDESTPEWQAAHTPWLPDYSDQPEEPTT